MMDEYLLNLIKKHYYSPIGLFLGIPLIAFIIVVPLDGFFEKGIPDFVIRLYIYLGLYFLWAVIWMFLRNYFTRNKKNKIGIVIAIKTENNRQKLLIKNDFAEGVKQLLKEHNLWSLFNTIVLQDYKANKAFGILKEYSEIKDEYIKSDKYKEFPSTKENKLYEKFNKKIHGHFYVWGTIKLRQDVQPTYFIRLDALVVHRPIHIKASTKISRDFISVFPKMISFREKFEVRGFETASQHISVAIRYMTGIAAFVSGDVFVAYRLHKGLQNEIDKKKYPPSNVEEILNRLKDFLHLELVLLAKYYYEKEKNLNKFKEMLAEAEKLNDKDYRVLVLNSLKAFVIDRDPIKSLQYLRKASRVHKGEYTWLYNKAFIYMYLEKYKLGDSDYKRLRRISFPDEKSVVEQCINFNEELLKNEPDKKQSYYILGYLYYIKKKNLPMALDMFEKFIKETKNEEKYEYLFVRAKAYLDEIKTGMGIKKKT